MCVDLARRFGRHPVGSITNSDVQSFAHDLLADRCAGTVRRIIATLIALLDFAVDHRWIETIPARIQVTLGHDPHGHARHPILAPAELLAVWAVQRRFSPCADVTLFLGLTGLRWGEFVALRPCGILTTATGGPMDCRAATVTAVGESTTFVISRLDFAIFVTGHPSAVAEVADVARDRASADERRGSH